MSRFLSRGEHSFFGVWGSRFWNWVVLDLRSLFGSPKIVPHPDKKDPKWDPNLERYPFRVQDLVLAKLQF